MPTLPAVMVTLLLPFEHLFDPRTWRKAQLLAVGAILSPGKRTVSSALNILGIGQHGDFAIYHQVLNRARWSPLQLSRALLLMVVGRLGSSTEPLVFGIDETVERRWGRKIAAKGRYRDPVRSKDDPVVMTPGLQWVSLMLLTRIGWAGRHWALPFWTALVVSARYDRRKGRQHKTFTDYAQQMLVCLRRWLPDRDLVVVADGGYAKREFLRHCQSMSKPIVVVTKLRKDASLYQPAPPRRPDQVGPSWYALRFWIELGFKAIKSLGWKWDKTRRTDPARISRHWLVLSVATLLALAYGTRVEDAQERRIAPGNLRAPPKALALNHRDPWSRPARTVSVIRHGIDWLRRLLLKGRLWSRVWLLPEPWPEPKLNLEITRHVPP